VPYIDFTLYKALNGFADRHDWFEDVLRFVALDAQFLFVALLAALFLMRGKWRSRNGRHGVVAVGFSAMLALAMAHFYHRPARRACRSRLAMRLGGSRGPLPTSWACASPTA